MDRNGAGSWRFAVLAAVVVAVGVGAAWAAMRSGHGNPDPGGRVLATLKTVDRALPSDAQVMLLQASEPTRDSCDGRAGTFGWNNVMVSAQFHTSEQARALVLQADKVLSAGGWQRTTTLTSPLGSGARWSRSLADGAMATATLSPATRGADTGIYWELDAVARPQGTQASGC